MEYSKEDLMEAKKQILGVGENMGTEESKKIWEENAQFWDNAMGDESNEFHREVVRPKVTELLSPNPADYILDVCLSFSRRVIAVLSCVYVRTFHFSHIRPPVKMINARSGMERAM